MMKGEEGNESNHLIEKESAVITAATEIKTPIDAVKEVLKDTPKATPTTTYATRRKKVSS